jgi:hypothetical protein
LEGEKGGKFAPPQYSLYLRVIFFAERANKKVVCQKEKDVYVCMYIKDWFKLIFPFLT